MALSTPNLLAADPDTSNVSSYVTPSVSPTANALVVVDEWNTDGTSAISPTSVTAGFNTVAGFTKVTGCDIVAAAGTRRLTRWVAQATGSPGSGTVTVDFSGDAQTGCIIEVYEYTGFDTTTPTKQGTSNEGGGSGATSLSISLAGALTNAGSQVCAAIGHNTNEAETAGSGGTLLASSDVGYTTPDARLAVVYEVNDTTVSASWTTSSAKLAVACEIVEATGGGGDVTVTPSVGILNLAGGAHTVAEAIDVSPAILILAGGVNTVAEQIVATPGVLNLVGNAPTIAEAVAPAPGILLLQGGANTPQGGTPVAPGIELSVRDHHFNLTIGR